MYEDWNSLRNEKRNKYLDLIWEQNLMTVVPVIYRTHEKICKGLKKNREFYIRDAE